MVCLSCMQKKTRTASHPSTKKDLGYLYMSYRWAVPTWDFLHSFAAKINEDFYMSNKSGVIELIKNIIIVLPCPTCQQHAKDFFKNINVSSVSTKNDLIQLLLKFHNDVQKRTGKSQLTLASLEKYKYSVFPRMAQNFITIFGSYKGALGSGFIDSQSRKKMLSNLTSWINTHYRNFL